jgi:hypothetical protein
MTIGSGKRLARDKEQSFFMMMPLVPRQTVRENDLNETAQYLAPNYNSGWCSGQLPTFCKLFAIRVAGLSNSITMNRGHICFSCQ